MSRHAKLSLVTFLLLAAALQAAPPPPAAEEAVEEAAAATAPVTGGMAALELTEAELAGYLKAFPKMTAFMNDRGAAFEASQAAGSGASSLEAEFEMAVGLTFGRFFEVHGQVTSAFAEALAARSRVQQRKTLTDSIAELEKAASAAETPAAMKKELRLQIDELTLALKGLDSVPAPEPSISAKTRELVQSRLDEIERVFTESDSPSKAQEQKGSAPEAGTTAPAGR